MMTRKHPYSIPIPLCLLIGLVWLGGCASSGGSRRESLSDATARAAYDTSERERGATRTKTDHLDDAGPYAEDYDDDDEGGSFLWGLLTAVFSGDDDEGDPYEYDGRTTYVYDDDGGHRPAGEFAHEIGSSGDSGGDSDAIERDNLNVWVSRAYPGGDTIEDITTVTAMYSGYSGQQYRAHIGLYYGDGNAGSQPVVHDGVRSFKEIGLDVGSRGYVTKAHTLVGAYFMVGLRLGSLRWDYVNLLDEPDGSTLDGDGLFVLVPYLGLGTSLLQIDPIHLGINGTWGPRFTIGKTYEGFPNDLYPDVGELKLNLEASVFF